MYALGSEEEAVLTLSYLSGAWAEHNDATRWLYDRLTEPQTRTAPSKAALKRLPAAGKRVH